MMKKNVLVLCTGNSARSQMAEVILKKHAGEFFNVYSAGLHPKEVHPLALKVIVEKGYDATGLRSKGLKEFLGKVAFDYVIFVCARAEENCPVSFPGLGPRLSWHFEDPATFEGSDEAREEKFNQVFEEIESKVFSWMKEDPTIAAMKSIPT